MVPAEGSAEVVENHPECFKLVNEELKINKPSIIRIPRYIKTGTHKIPLNKQNILKRDHYSCVYCGDDYRRYLTIDHVIPQSKGGKNTWDNLVTACFKCNNKKGSLDLEEFGVDIKKPIRPHYLMLMKSLNYIYDSWKTYLSI
jgi:5-methylcytosine-specific restriction endonuclease McrA